MLTVSKEFRFEAAHSLPHLPDGHKCRRTHGHSYRVVVHVRGEAQVGGRYRGMVIDYADIGKEMEPIVKRLDHHNLNEVLEGIATTAENLAAWIFQRLEEGLPGLWAVDVYETATTRVRYER